MHKYIIAPSLLSANFAHLGDETKAVLKAGADMIHLDVMDNHYVPNLTVGPLVCSALRKDGITAPIDVHLMVNPVDELIVAFAKAGASQITFHPEASKHVDRSLDLIKRTSHREDGCHCVFYRSRVVDFLGCKQKRMFRQTFRRNCNRKDIP